MYKKDLLELAKNSLNKKEFDIFKLIVPQAGVVFLKGRPGTAKSAICNTIADKLGFQFIDLRLSQMDELDLGLFPSKETTKEGQNYVEYVIPHWAVIANECPTLIAFEELNRASLPIRNAALQILNERTIGYKFKFNSNVYMIASGNIGEEDGTEVEEFDNALRTRLLTKTYDLSLQEWIDGYAKENINKLIISYLNNRPGEFYKFAPECETYATPRGWTYLSKYIDSCVSDPNNVKAIYDEIYDKASLYIGPSSTGFIRFLENNMMITIKDILNRFDDVAENLEKIGAVKKTELVEELKQFEFNKITDAQILNIHKFFKIAEKDLISGYLIHLIDAETDIEKNKKLRKFLLNYKELLDIIGQ